MDEKSPVRTKTEIIAEGASFPVVLCDLGRDIICQYKVVMRIRAQFQASFVYADSANWPGVQSTLLVDQRRMLYLPNGCHGNECPPHAFPCSS